MSPTANGASKKQKTGSRDETLESVKEYYAKVLKTSDDLKTNACCTAESIPEVVKAALRNVHDEVLAKYYGCGIVAPDELRGKRVLDLGCGAGRDVYVLAQFVGEEGEVVGVDMTDEQLKVARQHEEWHRQKFGYKKKNTCFVQGYMERLDELPELKPGSFDVIISNCVLNLSPDKPAVLAQAHSMLKEGGEFYFSDVYADRRVPRELQEDSVLWGECLSGALYWNDFERLAQRAGFADPRLVKDSVVTVNNKKLEQLVGHLAFTSATYRLFKLSGLLEPDCEDYGQAVVYKGTIEGHPHWWELDSHHRIQTGKVFPVCGNTYNMLHATRFKPHFDFLGSFDTHYGIFEGCGRGNPFKSASTGGAAGGGGSCC